MCEGGEGCDVIWITIAERKECEGGEGCDVIWMTIAERKECVKEGRGVM